MDDQEKKILENTIKNLRKELKKSEEETLSASIIKREIFNIADIIPNPPRWVLEPKKKSGSGPGVPSLMLSDLHWGEIVRSDQVQGVNSYNLQIARSRLKIVTEHTIDLLTNHVVDPHYPGIVVIFAGDMVSGDIHEELTETNEQPMMPVVLDLINHLTSTLSALADHFGKIFIPAVTGNHGRNTTKIRHKNRVYTSFDWLIYQLLARDFQDDKRFTFYISDGPDAYYRIFNQRYALTHGDQFRGGDGLIGPIGTWTRGNHKKMSRNMEIGIGYDTLLGGHIHTLMQLRRLITNGSLKGYCEYAFSNNYPFEPAQQALWLTHPRNGITISMPVIAQRDTVKPEKSWVSIEKK